MSYELETNNGKRIIFGIGSGRCGTHSLHELMLKQQIMEQNNTFENKFLYVKHEADNGLAIGGYNYNNVDEVVDKYIEMVKNNDEKKHFFKRGQTKDDNFLHLRSNISGKPLFHINISFSLLPYIEEFLKKYDNIRVVALKRDIKKTVLSIYKMGLRTRKGIELQELEDKKDEGKKLNEEELKKNEKEKLNREIKRSFFYNHFIFGKEELSNIEILKNIREYYKDYYDTVNNLVEKYPDKVKLYKTENALNDEKIQREMLKFCGFKYPLISVNIRSSKSS